MVCGAERIRMGRLKAGRQLRSERAVFLSQTRLLRFPAFCGSVRRCKQKRAKRQATLAPDSYRFSRHENKSLPCSRRSRRMGVCLRRAQFRGDRLHCRPQTDPMQSQKTDRVQPIPCVLYRIRPHPAGKDSFTTKPIISKNRQIVK